MSLTEHDLSVRIPESWHGQLTVLADAAGESRSRLLLEFVRRGIWEALGMRKNAAVSTLIGAVVDQDAQDQLQWLADDLQTSVSDLLRQGIVMALALHGDAPPDSLAHLLVDRDRRYLLDCGVDPADLPRREPLVGCTDNDRETSTDTACGAYADEVQP